jgi:hypothetical protein
MKKYADQRSAQQVYANLMLMGSQGVRAYKLLDPKMRSRIYATPTASKSGMTYSYYFMNHQPVPPTFGKPTVVRKALAGRRLTSYYFNKVIFFVSAIFPSILNLQK